MLARLTWLGGRSPLPGHDYFGRESSLLDVHSAHIAQVRSFLLDPGLLAPDGPAPLKVAYAAFNGAGRRAVPRILGELGVKDLHSIRRLDPLDGLFPAFRDTPGFEQQPDPGDPRAAAIAMAELKADGADWAATDLLIGTDPDADRCGVVVHPPRGQERLFAAQPSLPLQRGPLPHAGRRPVGAAGLVPAAARDRDPRRGCATRTPSSWRSATPPATRCRSWRSSTASAS